MHGQVRNATEGCSTSAKWLWISCWPDGLPDDQKCLLQLPTACSEETGLCTGRQGAQGSLTSCSSGDAFSPELRLPSGAELL